MKTTNKSPMNIKKPCYMMMEQNNDEIEITMYGEIVDERPTNWWTDEPIEGDFIVAHEFLADLEKVAKVKSITIRMNSLGGSLYAALPIYNRISDIRGKVTCIIDGVAMSAASLIMCACGKVKARPASLVMIHKCWIALWGGYNADELRDEAKNLDAWDNAAVAGYKKKCGLSETVITHMMAETTYLTGQEAVDKGFADELLDGEPAKIAASADGKMLYVNGKTYHYPSGMFAPDTIPTVKAADTPADEINKEPESNTGSNNEGGNLMAKNLEELRKENPELAASIEAEMKAAGHADSGALDQAKEAERKRMAEIDEIAGLYDADTIRDAKYDHPCSAQEMAFHAAQKSAKAGTTFVANAKKDFEESGAKEVGASPAGSTETKAKTGEERLTEARTYVKAILGKESK